LVARDEVKPSTPGAKDYDSLDVILIEDTIVADDGNIFRLRLGDQHSVEWIQGLPWGPSGAQRMFHGNR